MDQDVIRKTLKYAMASSVLQKRALDALAAREKEAADAAPVRARVFEHLCKVGGFDGAQRAEAESLLSKQAGVLEILDTVLDTLESTQARLQREKAAALGAPEPGRSDEVGPYGSRRGEISAADRALMRVLEPPTR